MWRGRRKVALVVVRQCHGLGLLPPAVHQDPVQVEEVCIVEHPATLAAGHLTVCGPSPRPGHALPVGGGAEGQLGRGQGARGGVGGGLGVQGQEGARLG